MAREKYDWVDDPWDEKKQAQDQEALRAGNSRGCLIGVIAMLAIFVIVLATVLLYGGAWVMLAGAAAS